MVRKQKTQPFFFGLSLRATIEVRYSLFVTHPTDLKPRGCLKVPWRGGHTNTPFRFVLFHRFKLCREASLLLLIYRDSQQTENKTWDTDPGTNPLPGVNLNSSVKLTYLQFIPPRFLTNVGSTQIFGYGSWQMSWIHTQTPSPVNSTQRSNACYDMGWYEKQFLTMVFILSWEKGYNHTTLFGLKVIGAQIQYISICIAQTNMLQQS